MPPARRRTCVSVCGAASLAVRRRHSGRRRRVGAGGCEGRGPEPAQRATVDEGRRRARDPDLLPELEIARDTYTVHVKPDVVVEIAFNEIQVSPRYPGGLALRFARVKRYRPDKSAVECDTFQTVQQLAAIR